MTGSKNEPRVEILEVLEIFVEVAGSAAQNCGGLRIPAVMTCSRFEPRVAEMTN